MLERLVDVLDSHKAVLHTYPITIGGLDTPSNDTEYKEKACDAAAYAHLVPDADLASLTTRMHVSRGGAMAPFGDNRNALSQTKEGLEQTVRESAYFLWQQEGCPQGRAEDHWYRAHDQHLRERAYGLWQQEGCPEGRANEYWHRTREFEAY